MHKILRYLVQLGENNNYEWFDQNRGLFTEIQSIFACEVKNIMNEMATADPRLAGIPVKPCIQRIQRDARFVKQMDNPFRLGMTASFSPNGKAGLHAGYSIHLEPGHKSYVAGGIVVPSSTLNKKVRNYINSHMLEYDDIINDPEFKEAFPTIGTERLQRYPSGFNEDSLAAPYVMTRDFVVISRIHDREFSKKGWQSMLAERMRLMMPFVRFTEAAIDGPADLG